MTPSPHKHRSNTGAGCLMIFLLTGVAWFCDVANYIGSVDAGRWRELSSFWQTVLAYGFLGIPLLGLLIGIGFVVSRRRNAPK